VGSAQRRRFGDHREHGNRWRDRSSTGSTLQEVRRHDHAVLRRMGYTVLPLIATTGGIEAKRKKKKNHIDQHTKRSPLSLFASPLQIPPQIGAQKFVRSIRGRVTQAVTRSGSSKGRNSSRRELEKGSNRRGRIARASGVRSYCHYIRGPHWPPGPGVVARIAFWQ